jgi:phthiocerol/phenolphthiocerol synthesis type-I polyketide synthase E
MKKNDYKSYSGLEIAVIGISGRFPGAKNIEEFWINLRNGVESMVLFSGEELQETGISSELLTDPHYVKVGSILENIECFDASFFGYTPKEAEIMDPQTRIFYECVYEALEDAGYASEFYNGLIGVYAGASLNRTWEALTFFSGKRDKLGQLASATLADKDNLSTRISYKLNLKGPAISLRTACSTSLVAVHLACRALLMKECDIDIAGGVAIHHLGKKGYLSQEGMLFSSDGHCRAFDAKASGTIFGDGAGVVVLKKLDRALKEGDHIYAVIKGSAINNDGYRKVGYTAPSVEGQADVIKMAQKISGVSPESISYIETHGTGTHLGDPIEIEALKLVFGARGRNYCALGSVKSNIGHLDSAAGVVSLIKTVLAMNYKLIPPSLHFEMPDPEIHLEDSPFYVNNQLKKWESNYYPLRAGVSSFGFGGTNAHVILEEAPGREESPGSREWQLILLSAKTETALNQTAENLTGFLKKNPDTNLADMAYTLQVGRGNFKYRKMLVCAEVGKVIDALSSRDNRKVPAFVSGDEMRPVFFMFSGLGSQYVDMGRDLYEHEPLFRSEMDRCFEILQPLPDYNTREILYPSRESDRSNLSDQSDLNRIETAQLAIFIFEYALARLLMQWGIEPQAMIGYSFGEYTAACIAGVFSLEEALKLVVSRGKSINRLPPGAMLSVPLNEEQVKPLLNPGLSLAIDNGESCIIAGAQKEIEEFEKQMKKGGYLCLRLANSHAIHSQVMNPILKEFQEQVSRLSLSEPKIPYISNVTGNWITGEQAADPGYWAYHLRETVRFADGLKELIKEPNAIFLEIGPGGDLSTLVRRYLDKNPLQPVINLVRPQRKEVPDTYYLLRQMGKLWAYGKRINWSRFYAQEKRHIISLPTYPFERQRYWIDGPTDLMSMTSIFSPGNETADPVKDNVRSTSQPEEIPSPQLLTSRPDISSDYVPPASDIEHRLVRVYQDFLGINPIGTLDDFFELGMDSLAIIGIGIDIYKEFNIRIPVANLFELLNIKELAGFISRVLDGSIQLTGYVNVNISPEANATHEIFAVDRKWEIDQISNDRESPGIVLLTGATGFLGSHILKELINYTEAKIYCLIRGNTLDAACRRGREILNLYFEGQFEKYYQERIFIFKGDITRTHLDMERSLYNELAGTVDNVIHCAADVRHYGRYDNFRETNTIGTQRIIEFCSTGKEKKMHHISTIGIFIRPPSASGNLHFRESDLDIGQNLDGHVYSKSKFEAEKSVYRARNNGLKASIYRIGNLVGRYTDGYFQKNIGTNYLYNHIKAMILLKKFPSTEDEIEIEMAPIDICSRSLVHLVLLKDAIGYNFHLLNPNRLRLKTLVEFINKSGYFIETVDLRDFARHINQAIRSENFQKEIEISRIFYLLRNVEGNENNESSRQPVDLTIDSSFTVEVLKKAGFSWCELDFTLIEKMLKHCLEVGYISSEST